jgi:hypothetical protein
LIFDHEQKTVSLSRRSPTVVHDDRKTTAVGDRSLNDAVFIFYVAIRYFFYVAGDYFLTMRLVAFNDPVKFFNNPVDYF